MNNVQDSASPRIDEHCAFCHVESIAPYVLQEGRAFRLVVDHAPLFEGHLLIIPKAHYTCYGDIPAAFDEELLAFKQEVTLFFERFYSPPFFWEHGIFRQTVFHAHLHCFPLSDLRFDLSSGLHAEVIHSQEDLRRWHRAHGQYFYLEEGEHALVFPPLLDVYMKVVQETLRPAALRRNGRAEISPPPLRKQQGEPLIARVKSNWHAFQQDALEQSK